MMAITFFHQLAFFDKIFLTYTSAKAGIDTLQQSHPKLFERAYKINTLFLALDIGLAFYMGIDLLTHLANRGAFQLLPHPAVIGALVCAGVCLLAFVIWSVGKINDHFHALHKPSGTSQLHWYRPLDQKIYQAVMTTQVVLSVALIVFSMQPFFCALAAATQGYRLLKISELQWLWCENAKQKVQFYFLVQKAAAQPAEQCVVCAKEQPTMYFCSRHLCHIPCAAEYKNSGRCPSPACEQKFTAYDVKKLD